MADPTPIPAAVIDAVTADVNRALGVRIVHRDSVADALANAAPALLAAGRTAAAEATEHLRAELEDQRAAKQTAAGAADRFRDVLAEALEHRGNNPGDDVLVTEIRQRFGKSGPEPTGWRDRCAGYRAEVDQINADAAARVAENGADR